MRSFAPRRQHSKSNHATFCVPYFSSDQHCWAHTCGLVLRAVFIALYSHFPPNAATVPRHTVHVLAGGFAGRFLSPYGYNIIRSFDFVTVNSNRSVPLYRCRLRQIYGAWHQPFRNSAGELLHVVEFAADRKSDQAEFCHLLGY